MKLLTWKMIKENNIFKNFDTNKTIKECFGETYSGAFVALHPFYKPVFADTYPYLNNLEKTYDLIETISWNEISTDSGFKDLKRVAKGILNQDKSLFSEISDYLSYRNYDCCNIEEDSIPEKIIIPFLSTLFLLGLTQITISTTKHDLFNEDDESYSITKTNAFDIAKRLQRRFLVITENKEIALLLPEHDCPYSLILGSKETIEELIKLSSLEGFFVSNSTRFDWWNE